MRHRVVLFRATLGILAAAASGLGAQDTRSELRIKLSSPDGSPVSGALVALVNVRDSVVAEGLASENGTRVLVAPRGTYRVRVRRSGYPPFVLRQLTIPRRSELAVNVECPQLTLQRIVVT